MEYIKNSVSLYFEKIDNNYNYIEKKTTWLQVLLVVVGISLISSVLSTFVESVSNPIYGFNVGLFIGTFIGTLIFVPIMLFLSYGFLHLMLKIFGGKGTFKETFKFGMSVSIFPSLIFLLLSLLPASYMENETLGLLFALIFIILGFGFMIWSLIISARVYSKVHSITTGKALIAMIVPMVILFIIIAIIAFILAFVYFSSSGFY